MPSFCDLYACAAAVFVWYNNTIRFWCRNMKYIVWWYKRAGTLRVSGFENAHHGRRNLVA